MQKKKKLWPYQNKSSKDLPGERWKEIPGFDGAYEISSFGRIKSLRRWRPCGKESGYYMKERIRQQHARSSKNHLVNEYTYTVGNTLKRNGKSIRSSTSRYVYHAFVKQFDLEDKTLQISYKDGNGLNLDARNLYLTNRSELQKKSYRQQRCLPKFVEYSIPVRQITMEGKTIAHYTSLKEAEDKTGINFTAIAACVDGRIYQSHGFRWESPAKKKRYHSPGVSPGQTFNKYLWQKLEKPRTSKKSPIASLNLDPEDMKGEKWKPIDGLEEAYMISNLGRVKGLPRFKEGRRYVWEKGAIKRLIPDGSASKPTSCLLVQLTKNGKKYQQSVARLVYHHFVKKINLLEKGPYIKYKNGKCFDLNYKNLTIHSK